jgi:hypothetical protein
VGFIGPLPQAPKALIKKRNKTYKNVQSFRITRTKIPHSLNVLLYAFKVVKPCILPMSSQSYRLDFEALIFVRKY